MSPSVDFGVVGWGVWGGGWGGGVCVPLEKGWGGGSCVDVCVGMKE